MNAPYLPTYIVCVSSKILCETFHLEMRNDAGLRRIMHVFTYGYMTCNCKSHPSRIASANANLDTLHETGHCNHQHYRHSKFLLLTFHSIQMCFQYIYTEKFITWTADITKVYLSHLKVLI